MGALEDGTKELIAVVDGYRELLNPDVNSSSNLSARVSQSHPNLLLVVVLWAFDIDRRIDKSKEAFLAKTTYSRDQRWLQGVLMTQARRPSPAV